MTTCKSVLLAATIIVGIAAFTSARADGIDPADGGGGAPALSFRWSGLYLGAGLGTGHGNANWTIADSSSHSSGGIAGWVAGGQIGYNWQLAPRWIIGAEGSLSRIGMKGQAAESFPLFTDRTELGWAGDLSTRLGVTAFDRTLLFAKTGLAWGAFEHSTANRANALLSEHSPRTSSAGWLIGGGIETALAANWTIKAEYNWIDFGESKFPLANSSGEITPATSTHKVGIFKFGINYKLDPAGPPLN